MVCIPAFYANAPGKNFDDEYYAQKEEQHAAKPRQAEIHKVMVTAIRIDNAHQRAQQQKEAA